MRVLITGSRNFKDVNLMRRTLVWVSKKWPNATIVHGAARGADTLAESVAKSLDLEVESWPAKWHLGPVAGPLRNQAMVDAGADLCMAFPMGLSNGTRDCMLRAQKAGIKILNVTEPDVDGLTIVYED